MQGTLGAALQIMFPELAPFIRWAGNLRPVGALAAYLTSQRELNRLTEQLMSNYSAQAAAGTAPQLGRDGERLKVHPGSFLALMTRAVARSPIPSADHALWVGAQSTMFVLAGYETTQNALAAA